MSKICHLKSTTENPGPASDWSWGPRCDSEINEIENTTSAENCYQEASKLLKRSDKQMFISAKMKNNSHICKWILSDGLDKILITEVEDEISTLYLCQTGCALPTPKEENVDLYIGLAGGGGGILLVMVVVVIVLIIKKKQKMCFKRKEEAALVHQNVLYGNLNNEDYHAERYDTRITDTNTYYDGEVEYGE